MKWSPETIRNGLIWKMKMGTQAYTDFVKKFQLFPSARKLQQAVQHLKFESGIQHVILQAVKGDVSSMPSYHRRCVMGMDEMAIQEAKVYDASVKRMIGDATFWPHSGLLRDSVTR